MEILLILKELIIGAVAGAISATLGYLKTENPEGGLENFDKIKFTKTVLIGAILGGISGAVPNGLNKISSEIGGACGIDPIWVKTFLLTIITKFVDEVTKIIWRRALAKILKK